MNAITAGVTADLTNDTYVKLALAISFPLVLYVVLLVLTKNMR